MVGAPFMKRCDLDMIHRGTIYEGHAIFTKQQVHLGLLGPFVDALVEMLFTHDSLLEARSGPSELQFFAQFSAQI